jgi:hypothetical protein
MRTRNWITLVVVGVGIALVIAFASPLASSSPDGLERVAEDKEFIDQARDPGYEIIPDYTFPGVENEALATILSGVVGVLIVAAIGLGAGYGLRARARSRPEPDAGSSMMQPSSETGGS